MSGAAHGGQPAGSSVKRSTGGAGLTARSSSTDSAGPRFASHVTEPIVTCAKGGGAKELYFITGGSTFEDFDATVFGTRAARKAFSSPESHQRRLPALHLGWLESGPAKFPFGLDSQFKSYGIREGFSERSIYVAIQPRHVQGQRGKQVLVMEHWIFDVAHGGGKADAIERTVAE